MVFKWDSECEMSFNVLKNALVKSLILTYPCMEKQFILDTDASGTGVGAVLSQIKDDEKRACDNLLKLFSFQNVSIV